ncbi:MAG: hypothetical protein HYY01_07345 [Chloroflexi bacterium]|nr:hypothetical protein [Chloroflexota bacterium]
MKQQPFGIPVGTSRWSRWQRRGLWGALHAALLRGTITVFGRRVGVWAVALGMAIAAAGVTGAAQAAVGDANLVVSQALLVLSGNVTGASEAVFTVSDDGTSFSTAASAWTGSRYHINIALGNRSDSTLVADLTVDAPEGLSIRVAGADGVTGVAPFGEKTWKLVVAPTESDHTPDLTITVKVSETMPPGFYTIKMNLDQAEY